MRTRLGAAQVLTQEPVFASLREAEIATLDCFASLAMMPLVIHRDHHRGGSPASYSSLQYEPPW
jgi:hypothetical protein